MAQTERLPEPSVIEKEQEKTYFEQLIRVLRNNYDILDNLVEGIDLTDMIVYINTSVKASSNNGLWLLVNVTYDKDSDTFNRIDLTKTSYGLQMTTDNLPYEANTTGIIFWRVIAGANPVSDNYGSLGGWENIFLMTEYRDLVVGGFGIEIDGAGILPYGRVTLSPHLSKDHFGIMNNVFNDYSGVDDNAKASWRAAINSTDDKFAIARAPASTTNFSEFLSIDAAGVVSTSTGEINTSKTIGCQVNNTGAATIATQVDGKLNDAIASVSRTSAGIVVVTFKTGYFSSTPVVTASPYGSVNNNWLVSVNSVSTTSATIYTFNLGTTLLDFHFTLTAVGV